MLSNYRKVDPELMSHSLRFLLSQSAIIFSNLLLLELSSNVLHFEVLQRNGIVASRNPTEGGQQKPCPSVRILQKPRRRCDKEFCYLDSQSYYRRLQGLPYEAYNTFAFHLPTSFAYNVNGPSACQCIDHCQNLYPLGLFNC